MQNVPAKNAGPTAPASRCYPYSIVWDRLCQAEYGLKKGKGEGSWFRTEDRGQERGERDRKPLATTRYSLLHKFLVLFLLVDGNLPGVFQPANDVHDLLLHLFDFGEADRAEVFHFFLEECRRPLGHVP